MSWLWPWLLTRLYRTSFFLFTRWLLMPLSKWNMAHFTEINEAPPRHQLRSRRRRRANKHGQFKKRKRTKAGQKGGPWSWATEVINSPVHPAQSTHPQPRPAVSASRQLCHANATETAHIKDLICYYYPFATIYIYVFGFFLERWKILFSNAQLVLRKMKVKSIFMNNVTLSCPCH